MTRVKQGPSLVGVSRAIREIRSQAPHVARLNVPVLVHGPTGSGKELVAQLLHHLSGRPGPLVPVNTSAIADSMIESSMFGHVRGAFTSAHADAKGLVHVADRGSLFLDEIGSMSALFQAKLLRVIETGAYRPVGSAHERTSQFRTISATNEPLDELVRQGAFRLDLLHRLSGLVILIPALQERPEDIEPLVAHFLASDPDLSGVAVAPTAIGILADHMWPGNVRELRNVLRRAAALARGSTVSADQVRDAISQDRSPGAGADAAQRSELLELLERVAWDTEAAAARLGVHRATLYRWMDRNHIRPRGRGRALRCRAQDGDD